MKIVSTGSELVLAGDSGEQLVWTSECELLIDGRVWQRGPWPVDDAVFELGEPSGRGVLVAGGDPERRAAAVEALADRGIAASATEHPTVDTIREAAVVVLLGDGHLPAQGMAVPAAGRLLVAVDCEVSFGLVPGVDHLAAETEEVAAALVDVGLDQWDALATMRRLGRRAAERHRSSVVYPRLVEDLAIEASSAASSGTAG